MRFSDLLLNLTLTRYECITNMSCDLNLCISHVLISKTKSPSSTTTTQLPQHLVYSFFSPVLTSLTELRGMAPTSHFGQSEVGAHVSSTHDKTLIFIVGFMGMSLVIWCGPCTIYRIIKNSLVYRSPMLYGISL